MVAISLFQIEECRSQPVLLAITAILIASTGHAQTVDLGSLDVPRDRIESRWIPVSGDSVLDLPLDTSNWATLDVTDFGADPANNSNDDRPAIQAAINAAQPGVPTRIRVPAGTYNMQTGKPTIRRSDLVLQCEDPATTHILYDSANVQASYLLFNGNDTSGAAVTWTAGYDEDDTDLTVSDASTFAIGDWIRTEMDNSETCPLVDNLQAGGEGFFHHYAKITNKVGNVITIDRPLRFDYTCGSRKIQEMDMVENVGVENCHIQHEDPDVGCTNLPNSLSGCDVAYVPAVKFSSGIVNAWLVNNHFEDWINVTVEMKETIRSMIQGNKFENVDFVAFNTFNLGLMNGAIDNIIENNIFKTHRVGISNGLGGENNVSAYNYIIGGANQERSLFIHGSYTRGILFEGNDVDGGIVLADAWWGRNGPHNTAFRNRSRGTGGAPTARHLGVHRAGNSSWALGDRVNFLANISQWILRDPGCSVPANCKDIDTYVTNLYAEKNVVTNDLKSGSLNGIDCGEGPGCVRDGLFVGDNYIGDAVPTDWNADSIPHSLYRESTTPPHWWCQEACDWSDVRQGIGAFGDDFSDMGSLCKLPAQIRHENGICTPVGKDPGNQPPAAPILLP